MRNSRLLLLIGVAVMGGVLISLFNGGDTSEGMALFWALFIGAAICSSIENLRLNVRVQHEGVEHPAEEVEE